MADTKISGMTEKTTLGATDLLVMASNGTTKKITGANLKSQIVANGLTGTPVPFTESGATIAALATEIDHGSTGSPITTPGPTVRIARVEDMAVSGIGGTGNKWTNEANAALVVLAKGQGSGSAGDKMQTNAVFAYARADGAGTWDAVGVQAIGRVMGSSTQIGTGAYLEGRKDVAAGKVVAVEVRSANYDTAGTATDDDYNNAGASNMVGLWITAASDTAGGALAKHGAAIQIGRVGTAQWGVGLGFVSGATADADVRSDSSATTSLYIDGTHTHALAVDAGAGAVVVGSLTLAAAASLLEVQSTAAKDPLVLFGNQSANASQRIRFQCLSSQSEWFIAGSSNAVITGTAAADQGIKITGSGKAFHIGGTTKIITVTAADTMGFYGSTPVAKPSATGSRGGNAALASLLTQLASLGLITDSTSA